MSPARISGRRTVIAVIGAGECDSRVAEIAYQIGRLIAQQGAVLVTGGMTGVMEAASCGAHDAGGLVVGIIPGLDPSTANTSCDVVIPTGMGQLRNGLVVQSADAVIAVSGEWGTLSEIGFALKLGKPVIGWETWEPTKAGIPAAQPIRAGSAAEAVDRAFASIEG
jgi:uncharacterized protein (TIGR00725 family)